MIPKELLNSLIDTRLEIGEEKLSSLLRSLFLTERTTKVFFALLNDDDLAVEDIMNITGIPESSVYRILKTFRKEEIIEQAGRFRPTKHRPTRFRPRTDLGGPWTHSWRLNTDA